MSSRVALPGQSRSVVRFFAALFFVAATFVAPLVSPSSALAQSAPAVHDTQLWTQFVANVSLSEQWLTHLEAQSRWAEDIGAHDQLIVRTALGRRLSRRITVWGGYAWTPRSLDSGWTHEQRIWQQLSATLPTAGAWSPSIRIRQEQRFHDLWDDSSHRLRVMGRAVRPLDAGKRLSIVAWNEIMFTLDDTAGGPAQGLDQNRVFAGILRKLSDHAGLESGYVWQTTDPPGVAPRRHNHVLFAWLNLTF